MVVPLFLILLIAAVGAVHWGNTKPGGVVLGALLGLTLAGTAVGPPILSGLHQAMSLVVSSATTVLS